MKKLLIVLCIAVFCSSCATIFNGSKSKITIQNDQINEPVQLTVNKKVLPPAYLPQQIKIKRGFKPTVITATAENYEDATLNVKKKFNPTTLYNLFLGGIPGFALDAGTGAMTRPEEKIYYLHMQRKNYVELLEEDKAPQRPVVVEEPRERVTRDNVGQTALERTIIRWYFDSDPKGARIFWRVISSIPAEVKNTNELWLGSTPFEETRSFNIEGLTYENARDVQIEIKVRRKGYIEQSKRFNVRQAIDQQEISSFFEMVSENE